MNEFASVEIALEELRQGRMIILVDDDSREQEGDLVVAAEKASPEVINFMAKYARGLICLTMTEDNVDRLRIPLMHERNKHKNQAAFTTSIEASFGVTTGISVFDRAHTIKVAIDPDSKPQDITMPGHIFPLQACDGGVFVRAGHTEGSVDLARLAGLKPSAVICEIMKEDGHMARLPDLYEFSNQHDIRIVAIHDLIAYRLKMETVIEEVASADLPLQVSDQFTIKIFRHLYDNSEHIVLVHKEYNSSQPCLVRLHSECLTGDTFGSIRCDCGEQLQQALEQLHDEKGVLLYMRQEGRGIGLINKIKAYHLQQTEGLDTVEANHKLGFSADLREYAISAQILGLLKIAQIRLLTNNPHKIQEIEQFNIKVTERVPLETVPTSANVHYLRAKRDKLDHLLQLKD